PRRPARGRPAPLVRLRDRLPCARVRGAVGLVAAPPAPARGDVRVVPRGLRVVPPRGRVGAWQRGRVGGAHASPAVPRGDPPAARRPRRRPRAAHRSWTRTSGGHDMSSRAGAGMPLRGDRIHRYVNAFCPVCHEEEPDRPLAQVRRLSGWLVERAGRIWLERGCPRHGLVRTLYDESPEILRYLEQWTAPTKVHVPDRAGNFAAVPAAYTHGLPEMQTQHTCILLEDLLDHCNLKCPTCFAASSPALASVVPLADVLASVDTRLARENDRIDVLMLSGGEPTLYPRLAELLDELVARPVVRILLN